MERKALHQRSLSELNIAASNSRVSYNVSDYSTTPTTSTILPSPGYASTRTSLSHSTSLKGQRISASESFLERTTFQTLLGRGVKEDHVPPSRNSSVKRRSRSSSVYTDYESRASSPTKRSSSVKRTDSQRISSGNPPPPYSPPPVTPTIRIVPKTPPASLAKRYEPHVEPSLQSSAARFSASYSSLVVRSEVEETSQPHSLIPDLPAPNLSEPALDKATRSLPSPSLFPIGTIIEKFEKASQAPSKPVAVPPIPDTPRRTSTIRLVPKTPPTTTPASVRIRAVSQPPTRPSSPPSRPVTSETSSTRPRSRSSGSRPISPLSPTHSLSSRFSQASIRSTIDAIGLPPSRPLPIPPIPSHSLDTVLPFSPLPLFARPPRPPSPPQTPLSKNTIRLVAKTPPAANTPTQLRPILKKKKSTFTPPGTATTSNTLESDITPPLNTNEFPEIQPALSWIIEAETPKSTPPKRARMQVDPELRPVYPHEEHENDVPTAMAGPSRWFSQSTSSGGQTTSSGDESAISAVVPPQRLGNARIKAARLQKDQSVHSEQGEVLHRRRPSTARTRSGSFSFSFPGVVGRRDRGQSVSTIDERPLSRKIGLGRRSSSLSVISNVGIPEWARLYYGRGRNLPMIGEGGDEITPVHLQNTRSNVSEAPSHWTGTRSREGQDLQDQFSQPRLDNIPVDRTERINKQVICFILGFVFPFAWMVGAVLPLPDQKRLRRRQRLHAEEMQSVTFPIHGPPELGHRATVDADIESLPSFTTFDEGRRWDNARWWRDINRGMSIFGVLIIGGIIALVVVGVMR